MEHNLWNHLVPVLEEPVVLSIGGSIANNDHGMAQPVAIAVGDIQDAIGVKL